MKINLKLPKNKLPETLVKFRPYLTFAFIMIGLLIYGFLMFDISRLNNTEPTQEQIDEKLTVIKKSKIDQASVTRIQQLQDQNIQVQTIFKQARDNPFSE